MAPNSTSCPCPDPQSCVCYRAPPFSHPTAPSYDPYPYPPPAGAYHTWDLGLASYCDAPAVSPHILSAAPGPSTQGPILPQPLGNITMSGSVNVLHGSGARATAAPNRKRRAPAASASNTGSKRRNISAPNPHTCDENHVPAAALLPVPAIPGAGPQITLGTAPGAPVQVVSLPSQPPPPAVELPSVTVVQPDPLDSLVEKQSKPPNSDATDVWYFVLGAKTEDRPEIAEAPATSLKQPSPEEFSYLGCRLCLFSAGRKWTKWQNVKGQTTAIRNHLASKHTLSWEDLVVANHLKGWENIQQGKGACLQSNDRSYAPFTLKEFHERLICFMAADDQSMGLVDCEEFRHLLEFICPSLREAGAIPHRTKLSELVTSTFREQYNSMVADIEKSLGRVSFTSDIWSRQSLQSYMAVTAHFMANTPSPVGPLLTLQTRLVAFRVLHGSHTGVNIGKAFVKILEEINCLHKISMVTLDNASNNATMMSEIQAELNQLGIPFDHEGYRIRCFPHVINLAVKEGLKYLTHISESNQDSVLGPEDSTQYTDALIDDADYYTALRSDVIACIRRFVTWVRASGQRREQFKTILQTGNTAGGWGNPPKILRNVGLKKEVETRWSSTYNMVDHFVELYLVCAKIIAENDDLADHAFTDAQFRVASDIRVFLQVFHSVQELVSAEKTPTLSIVLPLYELLLRMLKDLSRVRIKLAHAINASITKLEEYLAISRTAKMYSLAMVINPKIKFGWLKKHWTTDEYTKARESVEKALLEYARIEPREPPATPQPSRRLVKSVSVSHEAQAQASGYANLQAIHGTIQRSLSDSSIEPESTILPVPNNDED
ncbi:hypothetical protein D9619_009224 [Psilocybe cf. subviscida]|uniref:Uncharacterized protein n=1 Tax=Psilocybe cf. subviscida TaxID=2480587 RepID=A0A8H5FAF9_9AGAR|nr:hypothetical protein D9619_009224 [Psilocybe cf. subviscida]